MAKITKQIKRLIEGNPLSFATCNRNKPHVIGVAFVKVVSPNQILVTDNYMGRTIKNIKKNKNVAFAVWDKNWHGYQLKGIARYFASGKWHKFVKEMKENKGEPCKGAILVKISEIYKLN